MVKSYAVVIQKGGTGKTTTSLALAAGLARRNQRTLLIDVDQQGDATRVANLEPEIVGFTAPDVFAQRCSPKDAIYKTHSGFDIIPVLDNQLSTIEFSSKVTLTKIIQDVQEDYDYIVVDCPPHVGSMTMQALAAVDEIVIPVHADEPSINAMEGIIKTAIDFKRKRNRKLYIAGVLVNEYSKRDGAVYEAALNYIHQIAKENNVKVFETIIPMGAVIRDAWFNHESFFNHIDKNHSNYNLAVVAFDQFVKELTGLEGVRKDAKKSGDICIVKRASEKQPVRGAGSIKTRNTKAGATRKKTRKARL